MNTTASQRMYGGFWPMVLVCLSVIIFLAWNLGVAIRQRAGGMEIQRQQALQMEQAAKVEGSLKAMMADLIELAKEDAAAAGVLKKYNITMTPPAAATDSAAAAKAVEP